MISTTALRVLGIAMVLASAAPLAAQDIPSEAVTRTADHFPETNEQRHDLYAPFLRGRGGAYLGVGSDQSYTLAAMAGAELVYVVDYDPIVTRLHHALLVLVRACETPRALVDALAPAQEAATLRTVAAGLSPSGAPTWEDRRTLRAFHAHRPLLARRLAAQLAAPHTWLSNADHYAHVRRLAAAERVIARTGDLTGAETVTAMARDAARRGARFTVVYLSNAEEYFEYTPQFLANLRALPQDGDTLVLRTVRDHGFPRPRGDRGWHYDVQPLEDLIARVASGYRDSSWILTDLRAAPGVRGTLPGAPPGISRLDASVPARARPGPARWWTTSAPRSPTSSARRGRSRLLEAVRRAVLPALSAEDTRAVRDLDLEGTEVATLGAARLGADPRTREPFVLSGEPTDGATSAVDDPESVLFALLFDGLAREVLPALLAMEGRTDEADALRGYPMAADLYAAYRLRERLLELCPRPVRGRHPEVSPRACRAAVELVRPARTRRTEPPWSERERRIGSSVRTLAALAPDPRVLRALLERLATIARETAPAN